MLLGKINKSRTITIRSEPIIIQTKVQKLKKNNKKIARTRRQRGYHWEDTIVKRFNASRNWKAFRLGSPSVALPDVLAVNNKKSSIFTIEAKSTSTNSVQVPSDQIQGCLNWTKTFGLYKNRKVIFAIKFLSKKWVAPGKYEGRELREFFKVWDESMNIVDCICTYNGETFALENGKRSKINLNDYSMPFNSRPKITSEI